MRIEEEEDKKINGPKKIGQVAHAQHKWPIAPRLKKKVGLVYYADLFIFIIF